MPAWRKWRNAWISLRASCGVRKTFLMAVVGGHACLELRIDAVKTCRHGAAMTVCQSPATIFQSPTYNVRLRTWVPSQTAPQKCLRPHEPSVWVGTPSRAVCNSGVVKTCWQFPSGYCTPSTWSQHITQHITHGTCAGSDMLL